MLEVRWFFRVQILCHSGYWRVVPNPISLEYGEKVFQVFPPYVGSHLPPPIMLPFHPRSLKNPPIPPYAQKNEQPNYCGAVQERISSSIQRVEIPHCHSKKQKSDLLSHDAKTQQYSEVTTRLVLLPKPRQDHSEQRLQKLSQSIYCSVPNINHIFFGGFRKIIFSEVLCIFC